MTLQSTNSILVAVDAVLFKVIKGKLNVLLIQISNGAYKNKWAVPGGLIRDSETPEQAVARILDKKAGLKNIYLEQLYTFGDPNRDNRQRSISISYFALISVGDDIKLEDPGYYKDIRWIPIDILPNMAFDHKDIISVAKQRLKSKLGYSNIAYSLLPKEFTLTEMQEVYEIILDEKMDKRNFRKAIIAKDIIEETNEVLSGKNFRPAKLYRFKDAHIKVF